MSKTQHIGDITAYIVCVNVNKLYNNTFINLLITRALKNNNHTTYSNTLRPLQLW